jgi:O-antigen/teichoic acid export membrane protein
MLYLIMPLAVARGVLRGVQRFGHYNVNIVTEAAVRLAVGLLILSLVPDVAAALSAYVLALIATLLVSAFQLSVIWRGHERQPVDGREIRRFTAPMFVMLMTTAGFQNLDMLMVKSLQEPIDAGIYSAAFRLTATIGVLATGFNTQLLPFITGLYEQARAIAGPVIRLCGYFLLLAAVPVVLFSLWPREILVALQLREYEAAAPLLVWLTLARVLSYVSHMIALAGAAMNDFRFLWIYVPGLIALAAALAIRHDTLMAVVSVVLVTQGATLLALVAFVVLRRFGSRRLAISAPSRP